MRKKKEKGISKKDIKKSAKGVVFMAPDGFNVNILKLKQIYNDNNKKEKRRWGKK